MPSLNPLSAVGEERVDQRSVVGVSNCPTCNYNF